MAKASKKPVKKSAPKAAPKKAAAAKSKTPAKAAPAASKSAKGAKHAPVKAKAHHAPAKSHAKEEKAEKHKEAKHDHKHESKHDAKHQKTVAPAPVEAKVSKKPAPAPKKKKEKKGGAKEGFELEDDDLLASDDDLGSEEIPDLSEFDESEAEEADLSDEDADESSIANELKAADDEIVLTDAEGRRYCRVRDCDQISSVEGYCRFHYLLLWKKIQVRRKILADGKLERYVDELTSRYPDKFLEMIRKDLRTEKDFLGAIAELEIDESAGDNEFEDEAQSYVDEIRGMSTDTGMSEEEEF